MKDYLTLWSEGLPKLGSSTLESSIRVTGERNHRGPGWQFAKVTVSVEPATKFEVVDAIPENDDLRKFGYLDWFVFGMLDVLILAEPPAPLHKIRLVLEDAEYRPIDSSQMGYRFAGRDAGRKIIESIKMAYRTKTG